MKLEIGDRVTWMASSGEKFGIIKNFSIAPCANGDLTPWVTIAVLEKLTSSKVLNTIKFSANTDYLKMMKFSPVFGHFG